LNPNTYILKNKHLFLHDFIFVLTAVIVFTLVNNQSSSFDELKAKHHDFLKKSPFKKTKHLTKKERHKLGIAPNAYNQRQWELTMNPHLGHPTPEKVFGLQKDLRTSRKRVAFAVPGATPEMSWTERGPNNVGGRTRALIFDPKDTTQETVLAGGVSGGLWRNTHISDANHSWELMNIPENLAISSIVFDPSDSNVIYIGTGESYTQGDVVGNGVWKSSDNGQNWVQVFGGPDGETFNLNGEIIVPGIFYINDLSISDNNGSFEIYVAVGSTNYKNISTPTFHGAFEYGLFKSSDAGDSWSQVDIRVNTDSTIQYEPNDIEIAENGDVWIGTESNVYGTGGGVILKSTDGENFQVMHTISNGRRTEIELTENKIYVLAHINSETDPVSMLRTDDGFASEPTILPLPNDADPDIPSSDFARGQGFYNLLIEADPNNEDVVYAGGINLFKSNNSGDSWTQISEQNGNNFNGVTYPYVHADQHAMAFADSNRMIFGHDGGVSYSSDAGTTFSDRIQDYRTTQFYTLAVAPTTTFPNLDVFFAGSQDNGTQFFVDDTGGLDDTFLLLGGDGGYCFFSQDPTKPYLIANTQFSNVTALRNYATVPATDITINSEQDPIGEFINSQGLDSNLDVLYVNYSQNDEIRIRRYVNLLDNPYPESNKSLMTHELLDASPTAFAVSPYTTESSLLLTGLENGKMLKIENANTNNPIWSNISGPDFLGSISDVEFGATEEEIYVTFYNFGVDNNIFFTSDGGNTWVGKEGDFADIPVRSIIANPLNSEEVIIGTDLGVWFSNNFSNANPSWLQAYNGMSNVKVNDLDVRDDNMVYAATYGRGVFSGQFTTESLTKDKIIVSCKSFITRNQSGDYDLHYLRSIPHIDINIFNLSGQLVRSYKKVETENSDTIRLDQSVLSSGMYLIQILEQNNTETLKWTIY
jgi:photosystem II stability/assembly factor-like uncharacterized protein